MSEKGLTALIGLVAVLCTMWATVTFLPRGEGTPGAPPEALSGFFLGVTPEAVSTVRFQSPGDGDTLVLTRRGGRLDRQRLPSGLGHRGWFLGSHRRSRSGGPRGQQPREPSPPWGEPRQRMGP